MAKRPDPVGTAQHGPALVCVVGNGIRLASSGTRPAPPMPVFAEGHVHGTDHRYRADNEVHLPDGVTHLPLATAAAGWKSLGDRLRVAAASGAEWLRPELTAPEPVVAFHADPSRRHRLGYPRRPESPRFCGRDGHRTPLLEDHHAVLVSAAVRGRRLFVP